MIDEKIFKSVEYFKILNELSSYINKNFTIEDETVSYFEQYKTMTSDDDNWMEEYFENAQIFFNTEFIYEVDNSQYIGIYKDLDGRNVIVKLYHGGEIAYLGDTLSNWVETQYRSISKSKPERLKKFQEDCYSLFGTPIGKKFSTDDLDLRIIPDNNKIFIGQEYNKQ